MTYNRILLKTGTRVRDNIMRREGTVVSNMAGETGTYFDMNTSHDHLPNSVPVVFDLLNGTEKLRGGSDSGLRFIPAKCLKVIGA